MAAGVWTGSLDAGERAGSLALRLLTNRWRLRGTPNARRDPKKGSEAGDWHLGLLENSLSHSGNKLLSHGLLATSI